jgi:hypothetical protein
MLETSLLNSDPEVAEIMVSIAPRWARVGLAN